ncbi:PilZ domain-containing protein [Desulfobacterota bacterium M19]
MVGEQRGAKERRREERRACVDLWLDIILDSAVGAGVPLRVKLINLSDGGVCLISDQPLELGQIIRFPKGLPAALGTVVWTSQSKVVCKAGVRLDSGT